MPLTAQRESAGDLSYRIETPISAASADAELVRRHLRRALDDVALIVHRPVEGNDTVRLRELTLPAALERSWLRTASLEGSGAVDERSRQKATVEMMKKRWAE